MLKKLAHLAALITIASLSACGGGSGGDTTNNPGITQGPVNEGAGAKFVYVGPTVVTTSDLVVGTGAEAVAGKSVSVHVTRWEYVATAPDSKGIKQSDPTATPYTFALQVQAGAPALADAVIGMKVGGTRTAVIPGDMSTGSGGTATTGGVPRLLPYVAEIRLVAVN